MSLFEARTIAKTGEAQEQTEAPSRAARDEVRRLCSQILIQIPYRPSEGIHPRLVEHIAQWVPSGIAVQPIRDPFGGFIEQTRNYMCKLFLQSERRYLFMLDNDVVPQDAGAPLQLASHNFPVVSGIACGFRPDVGVFACVTVKDNSGVARFPTIAETKIMPAEGIREIESAGAGVLMIRRDVLESIRGDWFSLPESIRAEASAIGTMRKTEDICFSDRVRKAGFKLYADFAVQCYHDKNIPIHWAQERLDPDLDPKDWDVTNFALRAETE